MYRCDKCKELFCKDEVVFLCLGEEVSCEEDGGSGDIDNTYCTSCYEDILSEEHKDSLKEMTKDELIDFCDNIERNLNRK